MTFLLWGFLLFPVALPAQETAAQPQSIDRPYWRKTIEGLDYHSGSGATPSRTEMRQRQAEDKEERSTAEQQERNWDFSIPGPALIGKILLIIAAALILFLLLRGLLGMQWRPRNKRVRETVGPEAELEKIEADIEAYDLDEYIRKALERGAYATAIRLLYLASLKALSTAQLIRWKKDKTNHDYLQEMRGNPMREEFRRLTRAFEQIWYGDPPFTEADFRSLEPGFRRFIKNTQRQGSALSKEL